jgi:tetratricopeptide (TPR) repeat protein
VAPPVDPEPASDVVEPHLDLAERVAALRPTADLVQRDLFAQVAAALFGAAPAAVRIGRYTVLSRRGSGGMGTVFVAWDHALQRRIALKVLHRAQADRHDAILREARALARLTHPNIVQVYDVGRDGDDAFIAMALVDGPEIGRLVRRTRPTGEVLARWLSEAAAGLAAAHRAGLVHGDVKPANLLVGADGHPRWVDFGLATAVGLEPVRGGTEGYRAPELVAGARPGIAADVYALCVTALELRAVGDDGPWSRSVARTLARGLDVDPDRRCAMDDLVVAFAAAARGRRTRGLAATTLLGGAVVLAVTSSPDPSTCALPVDATWHQGARARTEGALTRLGPRGEAVWAAVAQELDGRAAEWLLARDDACAMPSTDRAPIEACLIDHDVALAAAVEQLEATTTAPQSDRLLEAIGAPRSCRDASVASVTEDELRHAAVRLEVAEALGDYPGALALAREYDGSARREGGPQARIEAALALGRLEALTGAAASGIARLHDAYFDAEAAGDDRLAARAAIEIILVTAGSLGAPRLAAQWRRPLLVALERGEAPAGLRVRAITALARAAEHGGDWVTMRDLVELLLEDHAVALAEDPVARMTAHMLQSSALRHMGDAQGQLAARQRVLAIAQDLRPPDHPDVGVALVALGSAWDDLGEYAKAEDALVRGIAVLERTELFDRLGSAQYDLGRVRANRGDWPGARAQYEAAARTITTTRGERHPDAVLPLVGLAEVATATGDLDTARARYEEALGFATRPGDRGHLYFGLGETAAAAEQWELATGYYRRARDVFGDEQAARVMHSELWFAEGVALARLDRRDTARDALRLAANLAQQTPVLQELVDAAAVELARLDVEASR